MVIADTLANTWLAKPELDFVNGIAFLRFLRFCSHIGAPPWQQSSSDYNFNFRRRVLFVLAEGCLPNVYTN